MQVYMARLQGSSATPADCEASRLLPSLPPDLLVPSPASSAVVTDPRNGQVLAVIGESVITSYSIHYTKLYDSSLFA